MKKILFAFCIVLGTWNTAHAATEQATEERVRDFFADTPVMIEIARCESNFRQFTDAGNPFRGGAGGGMVGVFQFYESIHTTTASNLGYDITTLEGNLAYAKHVYETEGTTPWNSAKTCWNTANTNNVTNSNQTDLERRITLLLQIIELLKQIQLLKAQLA